MDTRELTHALREATEDLEPRPDFAAAVVSGGRRRRNRNRFAATAAVAGVAAVAAVVAVTVPAQQSAPPPGQATSTPFTPKEDLRLVHAGGALVDDEDVTSVVVHAWATGMDGAPVNGDGVLDDRLGEPHIYWADQTAYGVTALVTQIVRLPADDRVTAEEQGQQRVATGVVATAPGTDEFRLLGVQVDGAGSAGQFLLPDDRTVVAVARPDLAGETGGMWVSPEIHYDEDGTSVREWTAVELTDGIGTVELAEGTNPLNVRLIAGDRKTPPQRENMKIGGHLPLLRTATTQLVTAQRGLPWEGTLTAVEPDGLASPTADTFATAVRGLLEPASYIPEPTRWTVVARAPSGTTVIIGQWQELDHPARLYAVTVGQDGRTVIRVEQVAVLNPGESLPVVYQLPDGEGFLVAAQGQQLSYRLSVGDTWSEPVTDAALVPYTVTAQVRVGTVVVDLPVR